jgi:hypothetical protein
MATVIRLSEDKHRAIYLFGLGLMVVSIPLSNFVMSVSQFILAGNWLWEGKFREKWKTAYNNRLILVLVSLFVLHVLGLVVTSDFHYAFKDLRTKLPLLIMPLVLGTIPAPGKKAFKSILLLYVAAVFAGTLISLYILLTKEISDIREISPFISHIRFSLNVCLSIFILAWMLRTKQQSRSLSFLFILVAVWFAAFLIIIESLSGILALVMTAIVLLLASVYRVKEPWYRASVSLGLATLLLLAGFYFHDVSRAYNKPYKNDLEHLEAFTPAGHPYVHDTVVQPVENGSYIGLYVCEPELREAWNARSLYSYDSSDASGMEVRYTLIRFLNSKGLRKDAGGVAGLSDEEIRMIERGIANIHYATVLDPNRRLYKMLFELENYRRGGNPGGSSVLQRIEFWKASAGIIHQHFWTGVGTGDMPTAFREQYEKMNSRLAPEFRWRSHNQYLSIFAGFGIFGFLWFIFTLVYPLSIKSRRTFLYICFFSVMAVSMFIEDTLESQAGVTLFAFFTSFLLFLQPRES